VNGKSITLHGIVLFFIVALVGCTGNVTVQPTEALMALPSPLPTIELTQSPTAASSPTPVFVDSRETLSPGMYAVYWNKDTWYIKSLGESDSRILIPSAISDLYTEMELSPDGNLVAYSDTGGRISIYDFFTGDTRAFTNDKASHIFDITWVRDEKSLYYLATNEKFWFPDANVGMYGVSLETEETSTIISPDDQTFMNDGLRGLALSEDGNWLAFYAPTMSEKMAPDPQYEVYLMDTICLQNKKSCVDSITTIGDGTNPTWSPDGKLAWVCTDGEWSAICVIDVNDLQSKAQIILSASQLETTQDTKITSFSWSPDGNYISINLVRRESPSGIADFIEEKVVLFSIANNKLIKITNAPDQQESWAGWSPDSRYLAIERNAGYTEFVEGLGISFPEYDIYIYDIETGQIVDQIESAGDRQEFKFFMLIE